MRAHALHWRAVPVKRMTPLHFTADYCWHSDYH